VKVKNPQFLVGIDLGTTHTVVAYSPTDQDNIQILVIDQLVAPGEVAARPLLPSVRYHPAQGELSEADLAFLTQDDQVVIGEAARGLGAKTQGRMVTSAKSWLSHPSVDHSADILPWGSPEEVLKVSPITASSSYLKHIRTVWHHKFPEAPLEHQDIVITVPASFDEGARSLTLAAARMAGLHQVKLLEEPQAVCYEWMHRHTGSIKQELADVRLLLICDVGGGTTDLTLIKVNHDSDEPELTRIGVGDHLMLGGDNIDLALAHTAEKRLALTEKRLSAADMSQLVEQCRIAKEKLLAEDAPEQLKVTLLGGGSKLIGGSRSAELSREEVRKLALDGFFPLSEQHELPDRKRSGVVEFGLPYTAEPAITKHIAAFLRSHEQASKQALDKGSVPDAILLNGGVFRSQSITHRMLQILEKWRGTPPKLLDNKTPELSVALGAVSYAWAVRNRKLRIGGGAARSYFLQIDTNGNERKGVCVLPKGSEEGDEIILRERQFSLRLGQPVRFHLLSNSGNTKYIPGELVTLTDDDFHSLPPLAVALSGGEKTEDKDVAVRLAVTQTEIGTLKIQCVAVDDSTKRWDVEFQIRTKALKISSTDLDLPVQTDAAQKLIMSFFGTKSKQVNPKAVKSLRVELEKILGVSRSDWNTPLLRALFSVLLEGIKYRRRSENHERVWLSLAGFCLRPGFGYPLDDWRIEQLWKIYNQNIQYVNDAQNWSEWWTLWRRVAGGLNADAQNQIFNDLSIYLNPDSARQSSIANQLKSRGYEDMVILSAVLERLSVENKIQLGEWHLKRLQKSNEPDQTWWAVGRIGSRIPFHGSSHNVLPVTFSEQWLQIVLSADWKKKPEAAFAATLIARKSGDRARDIDEKLRIQIVDRLKQTRAPSSWIEIVETVKQLNKQEEKQVFGEDLPPGLKLIH
jgi:molecular chaperone DnaK (HSP70)